MDFSQQGFKLFSGVASKEALDSSKPAPLLPRFVLPLQKAEVEHPFWGENSLHLAQCGRG